MDSSMLPNAARSYKDTTGNWEAGFFRNNWMVFVTLFVFTICLSLPFFFYPYPVTARQVFEFVRQTGNHLPEATEEVAGRQLRAEVAQISGCSEKK
jgi:cell division protein FtsX